MELQKAQQDNNKSIHCTEKCWSNYQDGILECDCGNDIRIFEWFWKEDRGETNFSLNPRKFIVTFHPIYSSGTSVVRGNTPFKANMHYYWELKMVSKLYGTDVMIGIGTKKGLENFTSYRFRFCSMLGLDDQTWGYSYHGRIQHDNLNRLYGESYGLCSKIGVHLNMCAGTLEYFIDRKPQGIAFTGLKNKELYPMACATAAQSSMKMICSVSQEETLQMLCLKQVQQNPHLSEQYRSIPGLYNYYSRKYFWITPNIPKTIVSKEEEEDELYYLAMNNNSVKRKQKVNYLANHGPNKKLTPDLAQSNSSTRRNFQPLRMDLGLVQSEEDMLRLLSNGTLNPDDDDSDSS